MYWIKRYLYQYPVKKKRIAYSVERKGSILIITLWALFFLAILAVAVSAYVWPQIKIAVRSRDTMKMYEMARAGTKESISVVEKDTIDSYDALKDLWSNNEEVFKEVEVGDGMFSIKYRLNESGKEEEFRYGLIDEERKININRANLPLLKRFFELAAGTSSQDAGNIASAIIDWRDEDEDPLEFGAESGYYSLLDPPYPCKDGNIEVLEELLLVKGVNEEIFNSVKDKITLYGLGAVNINTADELTLRVLGMSRSLSEKIIHFREGPDGKEATEDDNVFETTFTIIAVLAEAEDLSEEEISQLNDIINGGLVSTRSDNFMGESFGELKNKDSFLKILFIFNRDKSIKFWRQD